MAYNYGNFQEQLQLGNAWERAIEHYLQRDGYYVVPIYSLNKDGAPRANGHDCHLTLPDLQAFRDGTPSQWIECKYKEAATYWRIGDRLDTGLNLRHYTEYQAVQDSSGLPVSIAFIHEAEACVKIGTITELEALGPRTWVGAAAPRGGMIYWPYSALRTLCTLDELLAT